MIQDSTFEQLISLDGLAKDEAKGYKRKRFLYQQVRDILSSSRQFVGIAGLRGTGKTVLLRQIASGLDNSFYVSADTLPVGTSLFELAEALHKRLGSKYLMVDEIHAAPDWQSELKRAYDFLKVKIAFTSSSSIDVVGSKSDLSRRLSVLTLPPFSFREYLLFKNGTELPVLSLDKILANHAEIYRELFGFESEFRDFCTQGALPACLESPLPSVIKGIVEKAVQRDMLSAGKLSQEDLVNVRQALLFIARAGADGCSYSSISKNTGITKYKAQQYASLLSSASLAKIILPYGANVMPEPKILLTPAIRANMADGIDEDRLKGVMREEFFVHHIIGAGLELNYLKGARGQKLADYIVFYKARKLIFEIGGAGKGASQFKGVSAKEKFILSQPGSARGIPLILFGFLW